MRAAFTTACGDNSVVGCGDITDPRPEDEALIDVDAGAVRATVGSGARHRACLQSTQDVFGGLLRSPVALEKLIKSRQRGAQLRRRVRG